MVKEFVVEIKRPKNLEYVECYLIFNRQFFEALEIDLEHINKSNRSALSVYQIFEIFESFISDKFFLPIEVKNYENESCSYFTEIGEFKDKRYKIVFCVCTDKKRTIGVITLYRF
jgi:hypothetical protein